MSTQQARISGTEGPSYHIVALYIILICLVCAFQRAPEFIDYPQRGSQGQAIQNSVDVVLHEKAARDRT